MNSATKQASEIGAGRRRLGLVSIILLFGVILVGVFARLMNYELRRDEELYVPPAVLLGEGRLYEDFFYNHVPGSAWIFQAFHSIFGAGGLLFSARMAVFFAWIAFAAALVFFTWRLTRSVAATVALAVLVLANEQLLSVVGSTATNNFMTLPLAYSGICLFILGVRGESVFRNIERADGARPDKAPVFAAGACLAAALSIKVSAIAFVAPVAAAALFLPAGMPLIRRAASVLAPFALGGVLAALPVLMTYFRAPELFVAHVVQYHTGPHVDYWASGPAGEDDVAIGVGAKALLAHQIWLSGANLLLNVAMASVIAWLAASEPRFRWLKRLDGGAILALATLFVVGCFSFAPTPSFPQYFAPTIAVVPIVIALFYRRLPNERRGAANVVLCILAFFALIAGAPRLVQHLPKLAVPSAWTVAKIHQDGARIQDAMLKSGVEGNVATLLPIYPLEAGLGVYPELATGQFAYRTADLTSPALLKFYRTTSPSMVRSMFEVDPPAALLLGFEPELEAPMLEFAIAHRYSRIGEFSIKNRYGEAFLWVRPTARKAAS